MLLQTSAGYVCALKWCETDIVISVNCFMIIICLSLDSHCISALYMLCFSVYVVESEVST